MRRFNLLMFAVVVAGLAFGAFLAAQKPLSATPVQAAARPGGGQAATPGQSLNSSTSGGTDQSAAGPSGANSQSRAIQGSVASVDAGVLTVTAQQGDVKVKLADAKIEKTVDAAASDLKAGVLVAASGQQGSDGVYAASNVRIMPAGDGSAPAFASGRNPGQAAQGTTGQRQGQGGQTPAPGGQAQVSPGGQGSQIMGSVASVDGDTLTVTAQQGVVKVSIAGAKLQKSGQGTADDLKAGERVTISGQPGSDGIYTGATIQIVGTADRPAQSTPTPAPKP